ncbi:MAG TPA: hypothetical protein VGQ15_07685 [Gaiellaceae bacterium]|nr:hypothetical protein [Gaiellaceae bacterium]
MAAPDHLRHEWEESARRLDASAGDPDRYATLLDQLELVTAELRKRVGQTFTLADLSRAYGDADRWAAAVLAEADDVPDWWPQTLSTVLGAAFHAYARGAVDYGR